MELLKIGSKFVAYMNDDDVLLSDRYIGQVCSYIDGSDDIWSSSLGNIQTQSRGLEIGHIFSWLKIQNKLYKWE